MGGERFSGMNCMHMIVRWVDGMDILQVGETGPAMVQCACCFLDGLKGKKGLGTGCIFVYW